ncbi:hypothetical protein [Rugosimonospora africana]|uniref:Integrase SAM-like N-terminal domain-containing protein n=1 Tax=Rugosimonospora africana TaxID=556532 RepID=A0A8J3R4X8_9ACTN|nr:hypothetical protein [Rugosimonospora africana]GIH21557.1 hypothetical protein Raf01_97290 [Rugosimonospora africana]
MVEPPSQAATLPVHELWCKQVAIDQATDTYLDPAAGRITLAEWVSIWEQGHIAGPAKRAAYDSHLRNHILPRFGRIPLTQINRHAVKVFVKRLKTDVIIAEQAADLLDAECVE